MNADLEINKRFCKCFRVNLRASALIRVPFDVEVIDEPRKI